MNIYQIQILLIVVIVIQVINYQQIKLNVIQLYQIVNHNMITILLNMKSLMMINKHQYIKLNVDH